MLKDLLANSKCEGLRVYLADSAGNTRIVVVGVDIDGADLVTLVNQEDKMGVKTLQAKYLFGISEDKRPQNCEGATL